MTDWTVDRFIFESMKMRVGAAMFGMLRTGVVIVKQVMRFLNHKSIDQKESNDQCCK